MTLTYELLDAILPNPGTGHIAIFDIDSTILDTRPRNMAILQEAAGVFPAIAEAVGNVEKDELGWSITQTLDRYAEISESLRSDLFDFWNERFFSNAYVAYDNPYPGAPETVRWIADRGCTVVYLTGRDEPNMGNGTRSSLQAHGFPLGPEKNGSEAICLLKPDAVESDLTFKNRAVRDITELGPVALVIENEPENANMLARAFPAARVFLIDTVTAPNPDIPDESIVVFNAFPDPQARTEHK